MERKRLFCFIATIVLVLLFTGNLMAAGECDCTMTPTNMTVNRGENLEFDVTVTNNADQNGRVKFGAKITMPDGTLTGWVYGPTDPFWLAASGGEVSGHISYSIPSIGPVGRYTYHGYVGNYGQVYGECEFDFIVPADLPKTGQTTCYDADGYEIDCTGTGQDGEYQEGAQWPNPRFTDNGDGTVTDNMTGLVWLKNADCLSYVTWTDTLNACNTLAAGQCELTDAYVAGQWRMPNINELLSLIDFTTYPPIASPNPFENISVNLYWSSTTDSDRTKALGVWADSGRVLEWSKYDETGCHLWPVRGPE